MTNRDWAVVIWLLVAVAFFSTKQDVRSSVGKLLRTALSPKILLPFLMLLIYVAALVYLGWSIGIWNADLIRDTVVWTLGPAVALFVGSAEAGDSEHFFRTAALRTVKYTVFVEFYVNLVVFPLAAELVLIPFVTLLTLLTVVAATEQRFKQVHHFLIPMRHSTASYVGWLRTDSLVNSLDEEARRGFLHDIEQLIDSQYPNGRPRLRLRPDRCEAGFIAGSGPSAG